MAWPPWLSYFTYSWCRGGPQSSRLFTKNQIYYLSIPFSITSEKLLWLDNDMWLDTVEMLNVNIKNKKNSDS